MPKFKPEAHPGILELRDCNIIALHVNILSLKENHIKETEAFWKQLGSTLTKPSFHKWHHSPVTTNNIFNLKVKQLI